MTNHRRAALTTLPKRYRSGKRGQRTPARTALTQTAHCVVAEALRGLPSVRPHCLWLLFPTDCPSSCSDGRRSKTLQRSGRIGFPLSAQRPVDDMRPRVLPVDAETVAGSPIEPLSTLVFHAGKKNHHHPCGIAACSVQRAIRIRRLYWLAGGGGIPRSPLGQQAPSAHPAAFPSTAATAAAASEVAHAHRHPGHACEPVFFHLPEPGDAAHPLPPAHALSPAEEARPMCAGGLCSAQPALVAAPMAADGRLPRVAVARGAASSQPASRPSVRPSVCGR